MNQFNRDLNWTLQTSIFQGMKAVGGSRMDLEHEIHSSMAFVTYILVVGYVLGMQDRFSPEVGFSWERNLEKRGVDIKSKGGVEIFSLQVLATTASSALTALILEIIIIWVRIPVAFNS